MNIKESEKKLKRKPLSKSEIKKLNQEVSFYGIEFDKKSKIEFVDNLYYFKDKELVFFKEKDILLPSLKLLLKENLNVKNIIVDMGAIKFIVNGADIMRPGVVEFSEDINKDEFVVIKDINNKKPIAIGKCLENTENMRSTKKGKIIENIHYIGDDLWNFVLN